MEAMQRTHHRRALAAAATQSPSGWFSVKRPREGSEGGTKRALISFEKLDIFSSVKLPQILMQPILPLRIEHEVTNYYLLANISENTTFLAKWRKARSQCYKKYEVNLKVERRPTLVERVTIQKEKHPRPRGFQ